MGVLVSNNIVYSGINDYNDLNNKPEIGGVPLVGNLTPANLGIQATIDSNNKLSADLVDDSNSTNKLVYLDANGNLFIGGTQITQLIDSDSYAALVTKENRFYLVYPTPAPSNNGGE